MSDTFALDEFDRKILRALQENADYSMAELGEAVGLSHTPCWRRIKRLEKEGIIQGRVTLLNPDSLSLGVSVHAYITMTKHDEASLTAFEDAVQEMPEVVECYSTSGEKDYLLKVVVGSVDHYETVLKTRLVHLPYVASVNSTFALKQVKFTTQLPI
ncbi:Lrp/AsnC family transcriptional regulator [Pseudoteredinibacter isoporae]|uniref:Lrp/AsnC family transcriptional regulator n=1 Tax=Pseudoteredinibacter isoporae TaxID=570281 RepID=UPI003104FED0